MMLPTFALEKELCEKGYAPIVGIDEAGRGPLAGPVVAAAACFKEPTFREIHTEEKMWRLVRDSKTLSPAQRENVFDFVGEKFFVGIGLCDHETIDRMNILQATFLAMKKAIFDLQKKINKRDEKMLILVDGGNIIPYFSCEQRSVVKGDALVRSIAAASIVAKVTRDRMICALDDQFPEYGFGAHKGYGTAQHLEALRRFGPTPFHRKSFAPVRAAMKSSQ